MGQSIMTWWLGLVLTVGGLGCLSAKPASGHWVILCLIGIGKLPFGYEP